VVIVPTAVSRSSLKLMDLVECLVEHSGQGLMYGLGLVAGHHEGPPSAALEESNELAFRDTGEHCRVGDLVAVEVQDRQHGAVGARFEELVPVPPRRQRPRFRLTVSDDAGDQQIRVVEGGAEGVTEGVAELAALMDRAGSLGSRVTRDPAGERKLAEQVL